MFLLNWYADFLNIRREHRIEINVCETCEALKLELARAHDYNRELLQTITDSLKPKTEAKIDISELKPIHSNRHIPFSVRKNMLEAEDRRKAAIMRDHAESAIKTVQDETKLPTVSASTEVDSNLTAELEAELNLAQSIRAAESRQRKASGE